jgi:hypothetical protein
MNNNGYIEAGPSSHTLWTDPPVHLRVTGADVFGNKRKIETTLGSRDDNVSKKKQKTGEKQKHFTPFGVLVYHVSVALRAPGKYLLVKIWVDILIYSRF